MALPAGVDEIVFQDLKRDYEAKSVVVFAGAGVSAGAGLPTWNQLAKALVERMRQTGASKDALDEIDVFVSQGNLVNAMSAARHALHIEFDRELKRRLDDMDREVPAVATAIAALAPKLAGVVTTNLDRILERALGGGWPPILNAVADLLQRPRYIFKPHGTIDDASTWVFTRDEYDRAMFGSQALQDLFSALYRARTLLFVGASLADDDFGLTLGRVRALAGRNPPTHYAILPAPVLPMRRQQLEQAGIRLLVYENRSGTHHEVVEILQGLRGVASPVAAAATTVATGLAMPAPSTLAATAAPSGSLPAPGSKTAGLAAPVDVYLSGAPSDKPLVAKLLNQLATLEKTKRIRLAHEGSVRPGEDRGKALRGYLDRASIVLLMLSADYLASDDHEREMKQALARSDTSSVVVIPVPLRPCMWKSALGARDLKAVPEKAVTTFSNQDEALFQVVEAVESTLDALTKSTP